MQRNTVLISGASRGIGRAAALKFASEGFDLALSCRKSAGAMKELCEEIAGKYPGVRCLFRTADMGSYDETSAFCASALEAYGHIDVLVNNAGVSWIGLLTDMKPEDWRAVMSSNIDSVFNCCRSIVPSMVRRRSGRIINISSVWGLSGASCEVAYSASKGAVNAFTQALARELAPSQIAVNAIAFGVVDTEMNACFSGEELAQLTGEIPACRFASPEEAADMIFRLSQADEYLTGQIIRFDGGWT